MSNMGYCRFENTVSDLEDCFEHLHETDLSSTETSARKKLVNLCRYISDEIDEEE